MKKIEITLDSCNQYFMHEAFNTLRTNVLFCGSDIKTIVVTSCLAHEGKTTVSAELAKSLAESDKKVLFIDADLRKSVTVSRFTKEHGITGLSQLLSGQATADDCVYTTPYANLDFLFAGPCPPNPADLLGGEAFKSLLATARKEYDYVIVDAPPLGLVVDAALIASACDGSVIVINQGKIRNGMAKDVKRQLEAVGSKILGVILNQAERSRSHLYGAYRSHYENYYGDRHPTNPKNDQPEQSDDDWEPIDPQS